MEDENKKYPQLILKTDGTYKIYYAPEIQLKIENEDILQKFLEKNIKNVELKIV